jgi:hypothetical protein
MSEFDVEAEVVTFRCETRGCSRPLPSKQPRSELRSDEHAKRDLCPIAESNERDRITLATKGLRGGTKSASYDSRDSSAKR